MITLHLDVNNSAAGRSINQEFLHFLLHLLLHHLRLFHHLLNVESAGKFHCAHLSQWSVIVPKRLHAS